MKTEIEARLLECDYKTIIGRLEESGATFVGDFIQIRNCYDFNPVKENSWIRLRTNGTTTTLTIKEIQSSNIDGTKESEIIVSDFDTTNEILEKLGYKARTTQENRRIQYILNGAEIDIDFWPMIPPYLEIEADSEDTIKKVCDILRLDYSQFTSIDVSGVYDYYGKPIDTLPKILHLEEEKKNIVLK